MVLRRMLLQTFRIILLGGARHGDGKLLHRNYQFLNFNHQKCQLVLYMHAHKLPKEYRAFTSSACHHTGSQYSSTDSTDGLK